MTDEKKKYITSIKKALNEHLKTTGKSVHATFQELDIYKMGLNEGTFRKTFSYQNADKTPNYNLDLFCIITVCRYWGIDPSEILVPYDQMDAKTKMLREHPLVAALNREGKIPYP